MQIIDVSEVVSMVAKQIARCDFRVTTQHYVLGDYPWIITVGEHDWQRHLVVESIATDGKDATFAILSPAQSDKFGYDINTKDIEGRTTLHELTANTYISVKKALRPPKAA